MSERDDIAKAFHNIYLVAATAFKWPIRPEVNVPFEELSKDAQELDYALSDFHLNEIARLRAEVERITRWRGIVAGIHRRVLKSFEPWGWEDKRFLALALAGEVGELLNLLKKEWRGDGDFDEGKVIEEMADTRIYLDLLADAFGCNLDQACNFIVETKLARRWPNEYGEAIEEWEGEAHRHG